MENPFSLEKMRQVALDKAVFLVFKVKNMVKGFYQKI